jgi:PAS domain-containing protein
MAQQPIELILMKQLAGYLTLAVFVVDAAGTLVYYNEAAEKILGHRYEETGEMSLEEWGTVFSPTDGGGERIPPEDLPLARALHERVPVRGGLQVRGLDDVLRSIEVLAIPLEGQGGRRAGAAAVFWEQPL